ncbi:branched-chain amino acid ABC transporter permease [Mesorhizobium australafricanum]|uniref:Branched-chain amino acid ABC transporter permease n=1 Tax=Mesorhizobium australafricanum TaxID=3072311 RepID=A0ABU4WZA4_9HYPH|nr:branched-chain amino acid ABC transporter permease [Mesorhizobium sp. VK3E]MDX8440272.1 branched-chain amino acid ABC transporter permease [Mesorhizobium sp. VK3E]
MVSMNLVLQSLISGISIGCVYGLIGIGFCVIYNASGIVNFAQGAFVMLGGMVTYVLINKFQLPYIVAALGAIAVTAIVGAGVERLVVRPLWKRSAPMFVMILATLAAQIVIERLTYLAVDDQPKTLPAFTDRAPIMLGGVAINFQSLWIMGGSVVIVIALGLFFKSTRTGRAMRAVSINAEAAALQGIPVSLMLTLAFVLSALLGAVAGILLTPTQYTAFNMGVPFAISGFIAAIIGGFGRPLGAFIGGITLGLVQAMAILGLGAGVKNVAALSLLLVLLFIRPSGLLGSSR